MSKFSLDKFITKPDKSNRFPLPEGVKPGSIYESVFDLAVKRIETIESIFDKTSPEDLADIPIKERKIVTSKLLEQLGKERSNVRMDRAEGLINFINDENGRLNRLWESKKPSGAGKRKTKDELQTEINALKKDLKREKQKNLHDFFNQVVGSEILNSHKNLTDRYKDTQALYKEEQEKNANLSLKISGLIRELNSNSNNVR